MFDQKLIEKLQVLDGSRAGSQEGSAVRHRDLAALLQLPAQLKSAKAAGGTPTAAEFNALVDDVKALHQRLQEVAAIVQSKILR